MGKYLDNVGLSYFWEKIKAKLALSDSGSGTTVSADSQLISLHVDGKSVQDGTPSPSAPVAIRSVESRNLLDVLGKFPKATTTYAGCTMTNNGDGSFTMSGTNTGGSFNFNSTTGTLALPAGTYTVCGNGTLSGCIVRCTVGGTERSGTFTLTATTNLTRWNIYVSSSAAVSGTCTPMLVRGSAAREEQPYGSITLVTRGANLLNSSIVPASYAGVAYSNGDDGSVVLNGTKSGGSYAIIKSGLGLMLLAGTYRFNAQLVSGSATNAPTIYLLDASSTAITSVSPSTAGALASATITLTEDTMVNALRFALWTDNSVYASAAYQVWLEEGSTTHDYQQYQGTRTHIDLQGHALRSLPDGTKDELDVDAAGNVVLTQRVGAVDLGTLTWVKSSNGYFECTTLSPQAASIASQWVEANAYCADYKAEASFYVTNPDSYRNNTFCTWNGTVRARDTAIADAAAFKTAMNGVLMTYQLATPQTISLGTVELPWADGTAYIDAEVTPTISAEWYASGASGIFQRWRRTATETSDGLMSATDKAKVDAFSGSGILPIAHGGTGDTGAETIYETSDVTVKRWGRMIMVQAHGINATPSSGNAWANIDLSAYKPSYNISAIVSESTTDGRLARLWVSATDGKVYLNAIDGTTASRWYGTLTYIY